MILFNDPVASGFIALSAGAVFDQERDSSIVRCAPDCKVLGGVLFTHYNEASIQMHVAGLSRGWLSRELLWLSFHFPFEHLKVRKVVGLVRESNRSALDFDLNLGFTVETRVKDVFPDGDMLVLSMYRDACRFLNMRPRGYLHG